MYTLFKIRYANGARRPTCAQGCGNTYYTISIKIVDLVGGGQWRLNGEQLRQLTPAQSRVMTDDTGRVQTATYQVDNQTRHEHQTNILTDVGRSNLLCLYEPLQNPLNHILGIWSKLISGCVILLLIAWVYTNLY